MMHGCFVLIQQPTRAAKNLLVVSAPMMMPDAAFCTSVLRSVPVVECYAPMTDLGKICVIMLI